MPRIVHFELPVDDPDRAIKFYQDVFGWTIDKWEGQEDYWLVTTGPDEEPGINGALFRRPNPQTCTQNSVDVSSVDESVAKVEASGGSVAIPKVEIPGVGFVAYCQDTEGNLFGVFEGGPQPE